MGRNLSLARGEVCALAAGEGRNEPDYHTLAIEVAGLRRDIEHMEAELGRLREHIDKRFTKRETDVDKQNVALEARLAAQIADLKESLKNYTPITSFQPLTKWLFMLGAAVVTFISSVGLLLITALIDFWNSFKVPPG